MHTMGRGSGGKLIYKIHKKGGDCNYVSVQRLKLVSDFKLTIKLIYINILSELERKLDYE